MRKLSSILIFIVSIPAIAETLEPIASIEGYALWSASEGQALLAEQYDHERYLHNLYIYAVDDEGEWGLHNIGINKIYYHSASLYKNILYVTQRIEPTAPQNLLVYDVHDPKNPILIQEIESFYGFPDANFISDHWFATKYLGEYRLYQRKQDGSIELHSLLPELYPRWMNDDFIILMDESLANEYPILLELLQFKNEGAELIKTIDLDLPDIGDPWCFYEIYPFIYWHDMILFMVNMGCVDSEPEIDEQDPLATKPNQFNYDEYELAIIDHPFSDNAHVEYRRIDEQQDSNVAVFGANEQFLVTNSEINKLVIFTESNREFTAVADVPWQYPFFMDAEYLYVEREFTNTGNTSNWYKTDIYRLPDISSSFHPFFNSYQ